MGIFISASSDGTNGRGRNISSSERFCRSCNNNGDKCGSSANVLFFQAFERE
jgi:hypothetical protein